MSDKRQAHRALVARQPARITDADTSAVKASGVTEDQIFELEAPNRLGGRRTQRPVGFDR